jgi:hypothetical protein
MWGTNCLFSLFIWHTFGGRRTWLLLQGFVLESYWSVSVLCMVLLARGQGGVSENRCLSILCFLPLGNETWSSHPIADSWTWSSRVRQPHAVFATCLQAITDISSRANHRGILLLIDISRIVCQSCSHAKDYKVSDTGSASLFYCCLLSYDSITYLWWR